VNESAHVSLNTKGQSLFNTLDTDVYFEEDSNWGRVRGKSGRFPSSGRGQQTKQLIHQGEVGFYPGSPQGTQYYAVIVRSVWLPTYTIDHEFFLLAAIDRGEPVAAIGANFRVLVKRSCASRLAFVEDDLCGRTRFGVEVGECSVSKNDPQAKTLLNDIVDLFAFEIRKVQYSFDLWNDHLRSVL
jgi:hypothetical protein